MDASELPRNARMVGASDPVVSVVVPTKGRPEYLERCLAALANTDYPLEQLEVVVVNDGGGPRVARVARSVSGDLPVRLESPNRSGPSAARNAGAFSARGRFVAFTDDDCEPAAGWLAALARALEANDGAAIGGRTVNGAPRNGPAAATQMVVDSVHAHFNRDSAAPRFFASYNLAFPADAFRALGGFDERFRYAEDREMCERWLGAGRRFAYAPDALVRHVRTLTLRAFLGQHYGYGRGAWAFGRGRATAGADHRGVLRELARRAASPAGPEGQRIAAAGYVALSQIATAAGFAREAAARRLPFQRRG
jgi:GT2 family glycosyltransferase